RKCETLIIQQLDIIQNRAKLRNELTIPNQVIIEAVIAPMLFRILFTNHELSLEYVYDLLNRLFIKNK
ncbi:TetR family transcriptional regulator, partial [Acinetobacter baumannii]